jgi:exosortase A
MPLAILVALEALVVIIYRDTLAAMVNMWLTSDTYNHAFLVPPIMLWLIWRLRREVVALVPRVDWRMLVPSALIGFPWLLGELAAVNVVTQFSFVAMLVIAVPFLLGLKVARMLLFPLSFLFFAVPFGDFVIPSFMEWTATFTVMGLRASGIPVYQEGLHFVIPSGRWSVVEACSGVRYLIASVVVGALYAYINYRSFKRRFFFVGISILVPLIANWIRAYLIVMLGHFSNNQLAVGADHLIYGWVFFGVVILIMFAIGMRWHEEPVASKPTVDNARSIASGNAGVFVIAAFVAFSILATPKWIYSSLSGGPEQSPPQLAKEQLATAGWHLTDDSISDWMPSFYNPSATLNVSLTDGDQRIGVIIAYYRQQGYERKLISSENVLVKSNDKFWAQIGRGRHRAMLAGQPIEVRTGTLRSNLSGIGAESDRYQVWHWYWIGGRIVTNDHLGKLWLALSRLGGQGDESAAVFVYAHERDGDTLLAEYLSSAGAGINTLLEQAATQHR